jgi:hypothetical protein
MMLVLYNFHNLCSAKAVYFVASSHINEKQLTDARQVLSLNFSRATDYPHRDFFFVFLGHSEHVPS